MLKYINNQSVAIVNFLADGGSPYTCNNWGDAGISNFPIIVDDEDNYMHTLGDWFGVSYNSPRNIFIDHNFNYYAITQDVNQVEAILEEMLEDIE